MFNRGRDPFGMGFGRGFGGGRFGPRFERGEMKYVILDVLKDKPRHGYDIIQELKEKFSGFYSPSAGTIYPTLQLLEDQDLITSDQKDGKKVYTVTKQGLKLLQEHQTELAAMYKRMRGPWGENGQLFRAMREDLGQTARLVMMKAAQGELSTEQLGKIQGAVKKLREEVETIVAPVL